MQKRSTKFYRKNEAELMKRIGLKPTKNSGAGWVEKCDGENEHFLCELKSTDHESFSIKQNVLHALEYHAIEAHKIPLFAFQFLNRDELWLAIKESDIGAYKELIRQEVLEELKGISEKKLKKLLDKPLDKSYNKGEKERGGWLGEPNINNSVSNSTNSNIDVNVKKIKHNINARNNYLKQREQERKQKEQEFRTKQKERRTSKWKGN